MGYFEESLAQRDDDLHEIMVPEGSLISTPYQNKKECREQFENWFKETFN